MHSSLKRTDYPTNKKWKDEGFFSSFFGLATLRNQNADNLEVFESISQLARS